MEEWIRKVLQEALGGSRKVVITFKWEAIEKIWSLLEMVKSGSIVFVEDRSLMLFKSVLVAQSWGRSANRSTTLALTSDFKEDWFVSSMKDALDCFEAISA